MDKHTSLTLLQIAELGRPVIREKALFVENIASKEIQMLIDAMLATCREVDGVGIAAPQVHQSLQIFVIASQPSPAYPDARKMTPKAMINPIVIASSTEQIKGWEGCLSIPGIRGKVSRHIWIDVEYMNREGIKEKKRLTGFIARIFQHEFDHIQGHVFIDRMESMDDLITEKEFRKIMKRKRVAKK